MIRRANINDASNIAKLDAMMFKDSLGLDFVVNDLLNNQFAYYFVCEIDGEVIGYINCWITDITEILNFCVLDKYQNQGIGNIEKRVKHRQSIESGSTLGRRRVANSKTLGSRIWQAKEIFDDYANQLKEWSKKHQSPHHTEHIEDGMRHCGALSLRISDRSCNIRSDGCTDILAQHHCTSHIKRNPTHAQHNERNGHCCRRRLQYKCKNCTKDEKQQHRTKAVSRPSANKFQYFGSLTKVGHRLLHKRETQEQEAKSHN